MKSTIIKILSVFFLGIVFAAGAFTFVKLTESSIFDDKLKKHIIRSENYPKSIEILESHKLKDKPQFTIQGKFKNTNNFSVTEVGLVAFFKIDQALINTCKTDHLYRVKPEKIVEFTITCENLDSNGLPDSIQFEVVPEYWAYLEEVK